jgi:hypothetical protein
MLKQMRTVLTVASNRKEKTRNLYPPVTSVFERTHIEYERFTGASANFSFAVFRFNVLGGYSKSLHIYRS